MLNEPRRGGQSTGRRWSAKHGTPAKCMVGQQPRRGGRMTTTYTSYCCSATPSGLLIPYHRQAGVTLRSTTCLWSSQPFGLHFTTGCHTRQLQILQGIISRSSASVVILEGDASQRRRGLPLRFGILVSHHIQPTPSLSRRRWEASPPSQHSGDSQFQKCLICCRDLLYACPNAKWSLKVVGLHGIYVVCRNGERRVILK